MSAHGPITLDVDGGIARLTLASPDTGNAMTPAFGRGFRDAAEAIAGREDVAVVVLGAEGKNFCVGGDVGFFAGAEDPYAALHGLAGDLHAGLLTLAQIDAPVVARVQGAAAGAGMSLVCFADLAIGDRSASFTVAYTKIGLSPDGGSSWLLPRIVGTRRAAELMLTNRRVKADEAQVLGLLTEVVEASDLDERVNALASELAAGPTPAFGAVRRLLGQSSTTRFVEQLAAEAESIASLAASPVGREGVAAFAEKRAPDFGGVAAS